MVAGVNLREFSAAVEQEFFASFIVVFGSCIRLYLYLLHHKCIMYGAILCNNG
ncbi:hypothetical protein J2128_000175 [Methanomicrobium sp. W14]|nr:hypothetical protein [Methanomicrobium sp. W14]